MIRLVCVGNLKEKYLKEAANEYIKRISKFSKIEIIEVKEASHLPKDLALKEEAKEIHDKGWILEDYIEHHGFAYNLRLN